MIRQKLTLDDYDWTVYVYYAVDTYYTDEIMERLYDIGCPQEHLQTAYDNLSAGDINTGLTYSNYAQRKTVLVIGLTSSPAQFLNSWQHECAHLRQHIAKCFGIDVWGEEIAYLAGDIAQKMYPVAKRFLCKCYRHE